MKMPGLGELIFGENEKPVIERDPTRLETICLQAIKTKNFMQVSIKEYKGTSNEGFLLGKTYKTYSQ